MLKYFSPLAYYLLITINSSKKTPKRFFALEFQPNLNSTYSLTTTKYFEVLQNFSGFVITIDLTISLSFVSISSV